MHISQHGGPRRCLPLVTIEVKLVRTTGTLERGVLEQPLQPRIEPRPFWHLESAIMFEDVVCPEDPYQDDPPSQACALNTSSVVSHPVCVRRSSVGRPNNDSQGPTMTSAHPSSPPSFHNPVPPASLSARSNSPTSVSMAALNSFSPAICAVGSCAWRQR